MSKAEKFEMVANILASPRRDVDGVLRPAHEIDLIAVEALRIAAAMSSGKG